MTFLRFAALSILLAFALLTAGSISSSSKIEPVEQHIVHLPLIYKQSRWSDECIDCPHDFWNRSLDGAQLDSAGKIHVAYGGDQLYYAFQDGTGQWTIQVVDEKPRTGTKASLGMDSSDLPHILYCDEGNDTWKYTTRTETGWFFESLSIPCEMAALVVDSGDKPHIAIAGQEPDRLLRHGYRDVDGWHYSIIDSMVSHLSLAVDDQDRPRIVYNIFGAEHLKYAVFDGSAWNITDIGDPEESGAGISLALDSADRPHISYLKSGTELAYAYHSGSEWTLETAASGNDFEIESSLKLTESGVPYIAYTGHVCGGPGGCYSEIRCLYRVSAGNWINPSTWPMSNGAKRVTLLIDNTEGIHAIYRVEEADFGSSQLLAFPGGLIDVAQDITGGVELAIDQSDQLHTTYLKHRHHDRGHYSSLLYANNGSGEWRVGNSHIGWVGGGGLALGPAGEVVYIYVELYCTIYSCNQYWYLTQQTESGWSTSAIPFTGNTRSVDIAVGSQGAVHFSYLLSDGLYYWNEPTSGMSQPENVDIGLGNSMALVVDDDDQPCIAYHVNGQGLKYACKTGDEWASEVVSAVNASSISLDLTSSEQPHIVFIQGNTGSGEIKHATLDGDAWLIEPVAWTSGGLSMTIDGTDYLHLSYVTGGSGIIHAVYTDAGWQFARIEATHNTVGSTDITVDSLGNPHIAYVDDELNDLRIINYQSQ